MSKKKLLVEGHNDAIVLGTLCKTRGIWVQHRNYNDADKPPETPFAFECKNKLSISQLLDELDAELDESDLQVMGIVVDADTDLMARWQSLSARLSDKDCGYPPLPEIPDVNGTVVRVEGLPVIGIWVMPDNQLNGMLEDFVATLIPNGDALWPYAKQCVAAINPEDRPFSEAHLTKVQIHTWLAWRKKPGVPLGSAIKFSYLDADASQAESFVRWIRLLFGEVRA